MTRQKHDDVQAQDLKFDVRLIGHSLRRKKLTPADVEAHLAALPDEASEGEESGVRFVAPGRDR